ncbi:glycoside hydrolase family 2 TIM barrel-domain containing protein [Echinicola sp. 20G]|uniref:glycoside hydrolase family 2 TIM barrel-domain containing protein n=1 Tax=Echinicola sp. 20G TaxID=2781961 RepID=UPI0019103464|nr:glycoside hydrolase family 2 TIM barrel-domain containing protein [Echinicola sp. 20G]
MKITLLFLSFTLLSFSFSYSQNPSDYQRIYLSGMDAASPVDWEFKVSEGRKAGQWLTIPVPSNWEQHGFGNYNYGHDHREKHRKLGQETGFYKHSFNVPQNWKGKSIRIVFAGSMTDTKVKINGKSAGPMHQGAFYEFKYDITHLLKYGKENLLEVEVAKHSDNESINRAERQADFWIFGGIFRPVYLEVLPATNFKRIAIDAKASGELNVLTETNKPIKKGEVQIEITDLNTGQTIANFQYALEQSETNFNDRVKNIIPWNPERPKLYNAKFTLIQNGKALYTQTERIGFRTVDLRENDGLYVNGTKVILKGVNRHSFHPKTGRALSEANHKEDISLMKEMNMNAVRMSHYPPDERFLALCDSLGLFVLDEVTGWQDGYDTIVGPKLIKETVLRDENHPSVIIWDHGNEGGWDFANEKWFHVYDIQKRPVIYPWLNKNGMDAFHYPKFKAGINRLSNGNDVFMPTEMLHGLYDGGHGAGLEDYWADYLKNPRAAGGFLWVFSDEAIERTDRADSLDADGNHAPDGIVGPYREKEGSFYTIKDIWSPIQISKKLISENFDGKLIIENYHHYTSLKGFKVEWQLHAIQQWQEHPLQSGNMTLGDILPGEAKQIQLPLTTDLSMADWLEVKVKDETGNMVNNWSWPIQQPKAFIQDQLTNKAENSSSNPSMVTDNEDFWLITAAGLEYGINKKNGQLESLKKSGVSIAFTGPVQTEELKVIDVTQSKDAGGNIVITGKYESYPKEIQWTFYGNGLVKFEAAAAFSRMNEVEYLGIHFSFPEEAVKSIKWIGNGPYRVWQNRMRGPKFGLWEKGYNNTITGFSQKGKLTYPEFKGYHSNLYAYELSYSNGSFKVYNETPGLFFRLFTPEDSPFTNQNLTVPFPPGDLSFLYKIPAIGTKFHDAKDLGPQSQKGSSVGHGGDVNDPVILWFDFR